MLSPQEFKEQLEVWQRLWQPEKLAQLQAEKTQLEELTTTPGFWENTQQAATISQRIATLNKQINQWLTYKNALEDWQIAFELQDAEQFNQLWQRLQQMTKEIEISQFLTGQFDSRSALLTVYAGAGGVDAQDFAAMLVSMYQAFAKKQGWTSELIYLSVGEEGGVKTATLKIVGQFAFGLLKEEAGVHRLVRLSPFNAGHTRETSFAMVEVLPEGLEEEVEIELDEKDLRWDYFMSSGKGGQSVNTTYSAVRVVHLPTGLSVTCQNERSQQQNKIQALKYLKNKLAILELKKQQQLLEEIRGDWQSPEWGSQIRSYVMHPYKLVKDHRSGFETQNVEDILAGEGLLDFIWAMKKVKTKN